MCSGIAAAILVSCVCAGGANMTTSPASESVYLFTSFRGNGEDGLHLAFSHDGWKWTPLRNDASFLRPTVGQQKLMRDPSIARGHDGLFHMVWTTGWKEHGFGYARSSDLIDWSEQRFIPVEKGDLAEGVRNVWAPELLFDRSKSHFLIVWSSTRRTQEDNDHRLYCMTTRDFLTFSDPRLLFDPGYRCIDGIVCPFDGRYYLILKDERDGHKTLRLAIGESATGPFGPASDPLLPMEWIEGPSAVEMDGAVVVYFDYYHHPQHYGAFRTRDFRQWEDATGKLSFPKDHRHGTVLRVSESVLKRLLAERPVTSAPSP